MFILRSETKKSGVQGRQMIENGLCVHENKMASINWLGEGNQNDKRDKQTFDNVEVSESKIEL